MLTKIRFINSKSQKASKVYGTNIIKKEWITAKPRPKKWITAKPRAVRKLCNRNRGEKELTLVSLVGYPRGQYHILDSTRSHPRWFSHICIFYKLHKRIQELDLISIDTNYQVRTECSKSHSTKLHKTFSDQKFNSKMNSKLFRGLKQSGWLTSLKFIRSKFFLTPSTTALSKTNYHDKNS